MATAEMAVPVAKDAEGLFVCPTCRAPLDVMGALRCGGCGQGYLAGGVPCFNDRGAFFGALPPRPAMREILAMARRQGYRTALREHLAVHYPRLVSRTPLALPQRARGLDLLELPERARVLDFGCALGVLSVQLAGRAGVVVALDAVHEALEFLRIVREQDGLENLVPVCNGDPVRLPFAEGYFDAIILNAVFEYLPESIDVPEARDAHVLALKEFRRVLRGGGRVYIATKNRYSHQNLLGAKDHNGLRFTALLPRRAANWVSIRAGRGAYRTVTYSFREYQALLRDAGFASATFYWPWPDLWYPERLVPLTSGKGPMTRELQAIQGGSRIKAALWRALGGVCGLGPFVPTYIIVAGT